METVIHYVVMLEERAPVMDQLEGATINETHGAVTPVKARAGRQDFACDLDMSAHAGKQFEGAVHHGTGEPQFVNCPFCKETEEWKKDMAKHEQYANGDKGRYSGIFSKKVTRRQGGTPGAVASPAKPESSPEAAAAEEVLPVGN